MSQRSKATRLARSSTSWLAPVAAGVALLATGCAGSDCETYPVIPVDVTAATLRYSVPAEAVAATLGDPLPGACAREAGGASCSPILGSDLAPRDGFFSAASVLGPPTDAATSRRTIELRGAGPDLYVSFDLPDPRGLEGEHAWSSPVTYASFAVFGSCADVPDSVPPTTASGTLRVVSRTGGADGDDGVTPDYRAVVEVTGRVEAAAATDASGPCLVFPATEFTLTFVEDHVEQLESCPIR